MVCGVLRDVRKFDSLHIILKITTKSIQKFGSYNLSTYVDRTRRYSLFRRVKLEEISHVFFFNYFY